MSSHVPIIRPPDTVLEIVRTLRNAGFETWCVGGAVRDALLGHDNLDWDLATVATPPQVRRLFTRTVPVGIEFGTVGVLDRHNRMHEVTTFRRDVQHDGRHAVVEFGASLEEDLARRDFTINAMAFDPLSNALHDPFGGRDDLAKGVVRAVGVAEERMQEDRLRALRAMRFAARFDFSLADDTWHAIVNSAPHLTRLSPERVKQEIDKTMEQARRPSHAFRRWRESGAFAAIAPPLATVSDEVLQAVDCLPAPAAVTRPQRRALRIAVLCSDLAPTECDALLRALRFSNQDIAWITAVITGWQRCDNMLVSALATEAGVSDRMLRSVVASVGRLRMGACLRVAAARWQARCDSGAPNADGSHAPLPTTQQIRRLYRRALRSAFNDAIETADLAIDGDDLRQLGVRPGPAIGQLLKALLAEVLDHPERNTRDALTARARSLRVDA